MDIESWRLPQLVFGLFRQIPTTHWQRKHWGAEITRECAKGKSSPAEMKDLIEAVMDVEHDDIDYEGPLPKNYGVALAKLEEIAEANTPFPRGKGAAERERNGALMTSFLLSTLYINRFIPNLYGHLFRGVDGSRVDWFSAFWEDREVVVTAFEELGQKTHRYLLLKELLAALPRPEAWTAKPFITLVQEYPWYLHTEFGLRWCDATRRGRLQGPGSEPKKNDAPRDLATALVGVPDTIRSQPRNESFRDKRLKSDLMLTVEMLHVGSDPRRSVARAYQEIAERYGIESADLPSLFKKIRARGKELLDAVTDLGGAESSRGRIAYLGSLFEPVVKWQLSYLYSRQSLYRWSLAPWRPFYDRVCRAAPRSDRTQPGFHD